MKMGCTFMQSWVVQAHQLNQKFQKVDFLKTILKIVLEEELIIKRLFYQTDVIPVMENLHGDGTAILETSHLMPIQMEIVLEPQVTTETLQQMF
jgi:hypothetical protein